MRFLIPLIFLVSGCISKTEPDKRFDESEGMAVPSLSSVSISNANQFSFAIAGDIHIAGRDTSRFQSALTQATAEGDSFFVLLGDLADQGDQEDFAAIQSAITTTSWSNKIIPVIGNHDVFNDGWEHYKALMGPSHFAVTLGNSRFLIIDTADGTLGEKQTAWLEERLKEPKPTNTFIVAHYLPTLPDSRSYLKLANVDEALRLMSLATSAGVRGWLGGHYHSFLHGQIAGVHYTVAGGLGGRRMDPVRDYFFVQVVVNNDQVIFNLKTVS